MICSVIRSLSKNLFSLVELFPGKLQVNSSLPWRKFVPPPDRLSQSHCCSLYHRIIYTTKVNTAINTVYSISYCMLSPDSLSLRNPDVAKLYLKIDQLGLETQQSYRVQRSESSKDCSFGVLTHEIGQAVIALRLMVKHWCRHGASRLHDKTWASHTERS
ncbi:hypothetical protein KCV06_g30, partial [Aureobasidium melanogenum]